MVAAVRQGRPQRQVATEFGVALSTLQWWLARAGTAPLEQVDWSTHSRAPGRVHNGTSPEVELAVLACRQRWPRPVRWGFTGRRSLPTRCAPRAPCSRCPASGPSAAFCSATACWMAADACAGKLRRRLVCPRTPPATSRGGCLRRDRRLVIEGRGEIEVLTGKALWAPTQWLGRWRG